MQKKNKMNEKDKPLNKVVQFETIIRCKLTDAELLARGAEMSETLAEMATLEDTVASVKKEFQAKIDAKQARVSELSATIMSKSESRMIKCERVLDYKTGTVTEIRCDTKEVFSTREMNESEKQLEFEV